MRIVVIWPAVFWWEPPSSNYPFSTGLSILKTAEELGLSVIMELAGQIVTLEYAPDSFLRREHWVINRSGVPTEYDWSYYAINLNHPDVKAQIDQVFRSAAAAYRDSPALYGYDIWNETMFESHDEYTYSLFQQWLSKKYGSLSALNDSWDRTFSEWTQVYPSNWHWASIMPVADWQEFREWNIWKILNEWRTIIRSEDSYRPVLADNVGSMITNGQWGFDRPQNDWFLANAVDEPGFSFYPKNQAPTPPWERWAAFSGMRAAAGNKPFWIAEMQTHTVTMIVPSSRVEPYELRQWSLEAVAHGARGLVYWKWRPFARGFQTFGRGLVDFHGGLSERGVAVSNIAEELASIPTSPSPADSVAASVGILYSPRSDRFFRSYVERYPTNPVEIYRDSVLHTYQSIWEYGIDADFVPHDETIMAADGSVDQSILIATDVVSITTSEASRLEHFISVGGTLIIAGKFGIVDAFGKTHKDNPGGPFNQMIGVIYKDVYPIQDDLPEVASCSWSNEEQFELTLQREWYQVTVKDSDTHAMGVLKNGTAVVFRRDVGRGRVFYIAGATCNLQPILSRLLDEVKAINGLVLQNPLVRIRTMKRGSSYIVFLFNYSDEEQDLHIPLPEIGRPYVITHARKEIGCVLTPGDPQQILMCRLEPQGSEMVVLQTAK
jgi:beta-galactosidase